MLYFFTFATPFFYFLLITLSLAQNRTFDDANGVIIYNPPNAWTQMKVECALAKRPKERTKKFNPQGKDTWDRYLRTTSCTNTINATATFRFNGQCSTCLLFRLPTKRGSSNLRDGNLVDDLRPGHERLYNCNTGRYHSHRIPLYGNDSAPGGSVGPE